MAGSRRQQLLFGLLSLRNYSEARATVVLGVVMAGAGGNSIPLQHSKQPYCTFALHNNGVEHRMAGSMHPQCGEQHTRPAASNKLQCMTGSRVQQLGWSSMHPCGLLSMQGYIEASTAEVLFTVQLPTSRTPLLTTVVVTAAAAAAAFCAFVGQRH
jgi:ABC-type transporter Mla maintaining outer membrane lipid asymmetry permease subunit MlaE